MGPKMDLVTLLETLIGHNKDTRSLEQRGNSPGCVWGVGGVWSWYHSAVHLLGKALRNETIYCSCQSFDSLLFLDSGNQKTSAPKKRMLCLLSFLFEDYPWETFFIQCLSISRWDQLVYLRGETHFVEFVRPSSQPWIKWSTAPIS